MEEIHKYWAQLSIFVFAVGYLFKQFFRYKEIKFQYIFQSKLAELKNLNKAYHELYFALRDLYWFNLWHKVEEVYIQEQKVYTAFINFNISYQTLSVFLNQKEKTKLSMIKDEFESVHREIKQNIINKSVKNNDRNNFEKLQKIESEIFPKILPNQFLNFSQEVEKGFDTKIFPLFNYKNNLILL
jgi:hypothetical protein